MYMALFLHYTVQTKNWKKGKDGLSTDYFIVYSLYVTPTLDSIYEHNSLIILNS